MCLVILGRSMIVLKDIRHTLIDLSSTYYSILKLRIDPYMLHDQAL